MRIKKFTGSTSKEAIDKMREEFGEDAVVLNTRRINKGGLLGVGGAEYVEVTAAFDESPVRVVPRPLLPAGGNESPEIMESLRELASKFSERTASGEQKRLSDQVHNRARSGSLPSSPAIESDSLKQELSEVKSTLGEIAKHIRHSKTPALPATLMNAYTVLLENEVDEDIALEVVQSCSRKMTGSEIESQVFVDAAIIAAVTRRFAEVSPRQSHDKSYIVSLVGPTGVGKTTTIAKLSSIDKLLRGKTVAIITADTYRIGAIDQLKTFADIASIPLAVAYSPDEMTAAIKGYSSYDIVYVDTVGRSQRSADQIEELASFVTAADPDEVHLVMSANYSLATLRDVTQKFKPVKPNRVLLTKIDESTCSGSFLTLANELGLPFSYITDGQGVPEDIEPASAATLARLIYPASSMIPKEEMVPSVTSGVMND